MTLGLATDCPFLAGRHEEEGTEAACSPCPFSERPSFRLPSKAGPMSRVRGPSGPLILVHTGQEAASPQQGATEDGASAAALSLTPLSESPWQGCTRRPISWGMTTATAHPNSTVSEVLVRCSFIDNLSHLKKVADYFYSRFTMTGGKKTAGMGNGLGAVERVLLRKRNMLSSIYRKIIYITGMATFHLKYRIYLNWETAEIYKSLTVTWLNSAV